jgi:hypothetical protein
MMSADNLMRFHMGTAALGSLVGMMIKVIRTIVKGMKVSLINGIVNDFCFLLNLRVLKMVFGPEIRNILKFDAKIEVSNLQFYLKVGSSRNYIKKHQDFFSLYRAFGQFV